MHFSLLASGLPLLDGVVRTFHSAAAAHADDLRPDIKTALLAKKWREVRRGGGVRAAPCAAL